MRARLAFLLLLFPAIALAGPRHPRALAEGCVTTTLSCNATATGQLAPGDCNDEDGYYDVFVFRGTAGQLVEATVRSLDATYQNIYLGIAPPDNDDSRVPVVVGNKVGTVRYRLATSGNWAVVVGASDFTSYGRYVVEVRCLSTPPPERKDCVLQSLVCRQALIWDFTPSSCQFNDGSPYVWAEIWGNAGDLIRLQADTVGFQPLVAIYDANGNLLTQSFNPEIRHAQLDHFMERTGPYRLLVTNADANNGSFVLTANCTTSGCVAPLFLRQPADIKVPFGGNATVTFEVNSLGATTYEWTDVTDFPSAIASTNAPSYTFPNVRGRRAYVVTARTPCGTAVSRTFIVDTETGKRRAARH
ncbi:MAG TPA: hypothetical protein VGF48_13245 [Thermoanaerobaculia bacterium]|jgi:hypothetical protein